LFLFTTHDGRFPTQLRGGAMPAGNGRYGPGLFCMEN
jgi:hypothetical protein